MFDELAPAMPTRKLLLVGASAQHIWKNPEPIKAIDRYDGTVFRELRRLLQEGAVPDHIDIYILSTVHGLISADTEIGPYELPFTRAHAYANQDALSRAMDDLLANSNYDEVFVVLGKEQRRALAKSRWLQSRDIRVNNKLWGRWSRVVKMVEWVEQKAQEEQK